MNAFSWLNQAPVQWSAHLRKTVSLEDTHALLGARLCRVSAPAPFPCPRQARGTAPVWLGTLGRMLRADPPLSTVCCVNACAFPRGAVLQRKAWGSVLAMQQLSSGSSPCAFLEQVCSSCSAVAAVLSCSEASSRILSWLGEELAPLLGVAKVWDSQGTDLLRPGWSQVVRSSWEQKSWNHHKPINV